MKTINLYGDDYKVISTELARKAIEGEMSLDEAEHDASPWPNGEPIWSDIVTDLDGMTLWINNMDGEIILLSFFDESYYRTF